MTRYAVLLRGINLGRSRRVAMADLRELLTAEGYGNVRTLLQSGNVVLDTDRSATALTGALEAALERRFGFPVDVLVRSRDELLGVLAADPLGEVADDGAKYQVVFLAGPADRTLRAALDSDDAGDDRYVLGDRELYLWCPNGIQGSPLMAALGKLRGGPPATTRNWNTVRKLAALLD
jgi:uncharacterized protein (DUF1697 family)